MAIKHLLRRNLQYDDDSCSWDFKIFMSLSDEILQRNLMDEIFRERNERRQMRSYSLILCKYLFLVFDKIAKYGW